MRTGRPRLTANTPTSSISLKISQTMRTQLDQQARQQGQNLSQYVRSIISQHLTAVQAL